MACYVKPVSEQYFNKRGNCARGHLKDISRLAGGTGIGRGAAARVSEMSKVVTHSIHYISRKIKITDNLSGISYFPHSRRRDLDE